MMVFSGKDACVEEDKGNNEPKHPLGFADVSTLSSHWSVPSKEKQLTFVPSGSIEMHTIQFEMCKIEVSLLKLFHLQFASYTTHVCLFNNLICLTYFSKRFKRFCHGVCLICFLGFRVSSVTLAVTVTEIIILDTINYQLNFLQWESKSDYYLLFSWCS